MNTSFFVWDSLSHGVPQCPTKERGKDMTEKEAGTILERSGYRIPPYRLACMAKTAAKILQAVSEGGPVAYTLSEARLVLEMARILLEKGAAEQEQPGKGDGHE